MRFLYPIPSVQQQFDDVIIMTHSSDNEGRHKRREVSAGIQFRSFFLVISPGKKRESLADTSIEKEFWQLYKSWHTKYIKTKVRIGHGQF